MRTLKSKKLAFGVIALLFVPVMALPALSQDKATSAAKQRALDLSDAFADAVDESQLAALLDQIKQFNSYFPDIVEGDVVILDFVPNTGVSVTINKVLMGTVAGDNFQKALLAVYLGDSPPNDDLKDGMLGIVD
mgnify:CR=1 FL=1